MLRKYATAYLFPDRLVLHSNLQTDFGSFACGPFQRLDRAAALDEIGRCVRIALESSHVGSEMPNVKETTKGFHAGVGVKSNAQLQRAAVCVGISQAGALEFEPTHNGGTSGDAKGFQPIARTEPLRLPADAPRADIGAALMKAFSLCTTVYTGQ